MLDRISQKGTRIFVPNRRFRYDPSAVYHMAQYMRHNHIDIVHTRNCVANCWGGLAAILAKVPIKIASEHGTVWETGPPKSWIERFNYRYYDLVLTNSAATKVMVLAKRKVDSSRTRVVYDGIRLSDFECEVDVAAKKHELGIPHDHKVVGSIGRLAAPKAFHVFIEAASHILDAEPKTTFVLVGDGPLRDELERKVSQEGLQDSFLFTGVRKDIPEILRVFDVFVSTSIRESLGNAIIEAQLSRVPVVGPAVDGIPEIIQDGVTGMLLDPTEPVDTRFGLDSRDIPTHVVRHGRLAPPKALSPVRVAEAVVELLRSNGRLDSILQNAYDTARTKFDLAKYIAELDRIYAEVARQKSLV